MGCSAMSEKLVSIIMPTYNSGAFIGLSIESVLAQSYQNWELIIADDGSTDDTEAIVKKYAMNDPRINYIKMEKNSGPAIARNTAVTAANGTYMAFLDSDDIWYPEKLTKQIIFMEENRYRFTCTSYRKIDENGKDLGRLIQAGDKRDYNGVLKACPGNLTVIYNADLLGKCIIPDIRKRNDYVMWLQIMKKEAYIYGIAEPLASHRVRSGGISRNKISLVKYHWKVYREIEKLPLLQSVYLIAYRIMVTVIRQLKCILSAR